MNKFLITLLTFTIGCVSTIPLDDYKRFFVTNHFSPSEIGQVTGTYYQSSGFTGEELVLNPDSTFFYDTWTDILIAEKIKGYKGKYYIFNDTIKFIFDEVVYIDSLTESSIKFQQKLDDKIFLARLTTLFGISYLLKSENEIYIMKPWQKKNFQEIYSKVSDFLGYEEHKNKKYGKSLLVKSN